MLTAFLLAAVTSTADLKITDLKVGKGDPVKDGDVVTVLYKGTLADGKVFDETTKDKAPFAFRVGMKRVIEGWDTGLIGMKVGGKRKLVIPPDLAYGNQEVGSIPKNSTLTFEIELLRIDPKDKKQAIEVKKLADGNGDAIKYGDKVSLHYTGTFLNGKVFDSSRERKEPLEFVLQEQGMIAGFRDAVLGMKKGERKKVTIPFELAYGPNGRPPVIPAMATLVFDIEILNITKG